MRYIDGSFYPYRRDIRTIFSTSWDQKLNASIREFTTLIVPISLCGSVHSKQSQRQTQQLALRACSWPQIIYDLNNSLNRQTAWVATPQLSTPVISVSDVNFGSTWRWVCIVVRRCVCSRNIYYQQYFEDVISRCSFVESIPCQSNCVPVQQ